MISKSATRIVNADPATVMHLLTDVTSVDRWNTHVKRVDLVSSNSSGPGASRVCHFHDGASLKETVFESDDKHVAMAVSELPMPLHEMNIDFSVRPADGSHNKKTELTFTMHYDVKYGPLGYLLGVNRFQNEAARRAKEDSCGNRLPSGHG